MINKIKIIYDFKTYKIPNIHNQLISLKKKLHKECLFMSQVALPLILEIIKLDENTEKKKI